MNRMIYALVVLGLLVEMLVLGNVFGGQRAWGDAPADKGAAAYVEGMDALGRGDYPHAVQALTAAIDADGDNASYRRARGMALTLEESFPDAITDLQRAELLDPNDTEAQLWLAAAYRMSGDVAKGASLFTMRGLPHDYANLVYNVMAMEYWQSRYQGQYYDPATRHMVAANGPVKTLFPDAARAYAQRNRATGAAAADVITAQMKAAVASGNWALAIGDLVQLRSQAPDDPVLREYWAEALLGAAMRYRRGKSSRAHCAFRRCGRRGMSDGRRRISCWAMTRAPRPTLRSRLRWGPGAWRI